MATGLGDQFCLRWNNFNFNMTSVFNQLLADEAFVDVTLSCEGARIKAHRVVLSACSPYFQRVLLENPCKHPVLILPGGVGQADLRAIVEFIYRGETYVTRDQLSSIVRVAELLKIKGLCEVSQQQTEPQNTSLSSSSSSNVIPTGLLAPATEHHTSSFGTTTISPASSTYASAPMEHTPGAMAPSVSAQHQGNVVVSMTTPQNVPQQPAPTPVPQSPTPRPTYTPTTYRGRPRGRRPVGGYMSRGSSTWGSAGSHGVEKRSSAQAGLSHGSPSVRRPFRGSYRGSWHGRSSAKNNAGPSGSSNDENTMGSDIMEEPGHVHVRHESGHSTEENNGNYQDNGSSSSENNPGSGSTPMDHQNLYATPGLDQLPNHTSWTPIGHHFSPSANSTSSTSRDRSFKTEPEHANDFAHPNSRPSSQEDNDRNGREDSGDLTVTPEILGLMPSHMSLHPAGGAPPPHGQHHHHHSGMNMGLHAESSTKKMYTPEAMEAALESLRTGTMSLSRAAAVYGIPSTTLWQRAHRLGIDTPMKKDPSSRHWSEDDLRLALEALRAGRISANRASKEYGIPSSTLYKIARKEGIKLAAPFNASPTNWSPEDLVRALEAIRRGMSVQRAATQFGIPSGTLYGRCKREGIELVHKSYSGERPWSDTNMSEAMEAVRSGEMSINQSAIHFNVPYSSLYNRIKRIKALEEMGDSYDPSLGEPGAHPEEEVYEEDMEEEEEDPLMIVAASTEQAGNSGGIPPGGVAATPPISGSQTGASFSSHVTSYMSHVPMTIDYQSFSQATPTQNTTPTSAATYQQ